MFLRRIDVTYQRNLLLPEQPKIVVPHKQLTISVNSVGLFASRLNYVSITILNVITNTTNIARGNWWIWPIWLLSIRVATLHLGKYIVCAYARTITLLYYFTFILVDFLRATSNKLAANMISDVHLAIFANVLGVFLFLLVVAYHYINANIAR